jgi:hypothetical protein
LTYGCLWGGTLNTVAELRGKLEEGRGSLYIVETFWLFPFHFFFPSRKSDKNQNKIQDKAFMTAKWSINNTKKDTYFWCSMILG